MTALDREFEQMVRLLYSGDAYMGLREKQVLVMKTLFMAGITLSQRLEDSGETTRADLLRDAMCFLNTRHNG